MAGKETNNVHRGIWMTAILWRGHAKNWKRYFKPMLDRGELTMKQIIQSYNSWYGYNMHLDCHRSLRQMDRLFIELYGINPHRRS